MVFPEYDLDKLWRDTQRTQIKNLMDFPDTDLELHKVKIQAWTSE